MRIRIPRIRNIERVGDATNGLWLNLKKQTQHQSAQDRIIFNVHSSFSSLFFMAESIATILPRNLSNFSSGLFGVYLFFVLGSHSKSNRNVKLVNLLIVAPLAL
jgi:hypothetical protein